MGKQSRRRQFRRVFKDAPRATVELNDAGDARQFHVGMSISGPPEMFGLPPDPAGTPPSSPVVVTDVDYVNGVITLSTISTL